MLLKNKEELKNLMGLYQNDDVTLKAKTAEAKQSRENFWKEFEQLKRDVIWPTIVEIGNELTQYGHDYHVAEEEGYVDAIATAHPANLTFSIYPGRLAQQFKKPESSPYISFVANDYAKKIGINVSTMMPEEGGEVGSHGEYDPSQLTKEFVENEIINVLKNTLIFHKSE